MNERYSRLYSLPERLYSEGAPVLIAAGALLRDNQTGHMLAQLKFESLSAKPIRALKVALRAFDVTGTELAGLSEYQYLDLNVQRGSEFGQKVAVLLPDDVTRSFSCVCSSVVFSDGSIWTAPADAVWEPLKQQTTLDGCLGSELAAQYRRETFSGAVYAVTEDRDLWMCTCGAVNRCSESYCYKCRSYRGGLLSAMDADKLREHAKEYAERKARKAAEEKAHEEKKAAERQVRRAKRKKTLLTSGLATAVLIIALIILTKVVIPNSRYNTGLKLMGEGDYNKAITTFEALGDYKDSAAQLKACEKERDYLAAVALMDAGLYDDAIGGFEALGNYNDSTEQIKACVLAQNERDYQAAIQLFDAGQYADACAAFEALGDYSDSTDKVKECYKQYYGDIYEIIDGAVAVDTITFGSFEQDGDASNGAEPIEWYVYSISHKGNTVSAKLLSKYALFRFTSSNKKIYWSESENFRTLETGMKSAFGENVDKLHMSFGIPDSSIINEYPFIGKCLAAPSIMDGHEVQDGYCHWIARDGRPQSKYTEYSKYLDIIDWNGHREIYDVYGAMRHGGEYENYLYGMRVDLTIYFPALS